MPHSATDTLDSDTIAAIATPAGRGGIGVVRLSGPASQPIAEQIVSLRHPLQPGRVRYGFLLDHAGKRVDDAIVTLYRAPHSYTGEDVTEIATHGSPVVLEWVLTTAMQAGARLARPGEFTERAFLRNRLDLTQAEAVRDLIDAQTIAQARLAAEQIGGSLAREIGPTKQQLIHLIATLEAGIDFAEDDLETLPDLEIQQRIAAMLPPLELLLQSFSRGRLLREGLRLAIVGKPNAGKSSLFNRLLARERAIVTPVAGTTRDVVSDRLVLEGIPIELLDTAGLHETAEEVERIGIARSYEAMAEADLIVLVIDCAEQRPSHARHATAPHGNGTGAASQPPPITNTAGGVESIAPGAAYPSAASTDPGAASIDPETASMDSGAAYPGAASIDPGPANLALITAGSVASQVSEIAAAAPGRPLLVLFNKVDLLTDRSHLQQQFTGEGPQSAFLASALTGEGIHELQSAILRGTGASPEAQSSPAQKPAAQNPHIDTSAVTLSNVRQRDSLAQCVSALTHASTAAANRTPHEMLLLTLYEALQHLNQLTGETTSDDILNLIFSTFCIGK